MKNENWKDIRNFENIYQISDKGRVRNSNKKILKNNINCHGYTIIYLNKENKKYAKKIHRLVAEAFIENKYNKPCVNHIDGNKNNNNKENLEWVTYSENMLHAYANGLCENTRNLAKSRILEKHGRTKKIKQYDLNGNLIKEWFCIKSAQDALGLKESSNIIACCKGRYKTAYGFIWKYSD